MRFLMIARIKSINPVDGRSTFGVEGFIHASIPFTVTNCAFLPSGKHNSLPLAVLGDYSGTVRLKPYDF
jgi:hypothetical protein